MEVWGSSDMLLWKCSSSAMYEPAKECVPGFASPALCYPWHEISAVTRQGIARWPRGHSCSAISWLTPSLIEVINRAGLVWIGGRLSLGQGDAPSRPSWRILALLSPCWPSWLSIASDSQSNDGSRWQLSSHSWQTCGPGSSASASYGSFYSVSRLL